MKRFAIQSLLAVLVSAVVAPALLAADYHEGLAAHQRGDYEAALREWQPLASQGDRESQYRLARMYYHGEGLRDDAQAAKWYGLAAEQGHVRAQNNLGLLYEQGRGVEQDMAAAARWYRRAAEQGLATAQSNLARMYDRGRGVAEDHAEAADWYRKAAEQGHAQAQYRLGQMFESGIGLPQDPGKAAKWYRRSAKQGNGPAQAALGAMYAEGRGVGQDVEKATKWLGRASAQGIAVTNVLPPPEDAPEESPEPETAAVEADDPAPEPAPTPVLPSPAPTVEAATMPFEFPELQQMMRDADNGDADAQYRLAGMFSTGEGAPQNLEDAARWYRFAAEQGHEMAAYKLAFLYLRGRGVPDKDYVQAYRWFFVADELGVGDAGQWRDRIRKKMTERELVEADALVEQWKTKERG